MNGFSVSGVCWRSGWVPRVTCQRSAGDGTQSSARTFVVELAHVVVIYCLLELKLQASRFEVEVWWG